jgi:hypothetical protein
LRPVHLDDGYVTGLPVPGAKVLPPTRYKDCAPDARSLPWYFDEPLAQAACAMANINWSAQTQVAVFADEAGKPVPFGYRGITSPLPFVTGDDGVTFHLGATFLDKIPEGFVHAGMPLGHAHGKPLIEWICGPVAPVGGNRFRVALDRTWPESPIFLRVWHPGDGEFRHSVQPGEIKLNPNKQGQPQTITFDAIPDQSLAVKSIPLHATSNAGLPVRFFVRAGPAEVHGDRLVFTEIPARSKMPVTVTVTAWQWGRVSEGAVQTAEIVERSFRVRRD